MKFNDLEIGHGAPDKPCELSSEWLRHYEDDDGQMQTFLKRFDFESQSEIAMCVKTILRTVVNDKYFAKPNRDIMGDVRTVYTRAVKILDNQQNCDNYCNGIAEAMWRGEYARRVLDKRTAELLDGEPSMGVFNGVCERVKATYDLSDIDIQKITFFVQQVRAGAEFPKSLRRMLYIWGAQKKTGKTTCAETLVSILNGEPDLKNKTAYNTSLADEMQFKPYAVPRISHANCCLMDECFYADMGKTYADFKRFMTSCDGAARLPYGQPFRWIGQPNYIATSNDPLQTFIKDWNDRRYLSVEFKGKPKETLTFEEIYLMWLTFVRNVPKVYNWRETAERIAYAADEVGERAIFADEYELELRQAAFTSFINQQPSAALRTSSQNRLSLKFFIDYFAQRDNTARSKRKEIQHAVESVFGATTIAGRWWLLDDIKDRCQELALETYSDNSESEQEDVKLPF